MQIGNNIQRLRYLIATPTGKDLLLVYFGKVFEAIVAMAASILIARGLNDPARMGEVTLVLSFATILGGVMGFGLDATGVKFVSDARANKPETVSKVVWNILFLRLICITVCVLIASFAAGHVMTKWFNFKGDHGILLIGIALAAANALFAVILAVFRGFRKFGCVFMSNSIGRLSRLFFLAICLLWGMINVTSILFANLVAAVVIILVAACFWRRLGLSRPGGAFNQEIFSNIVKYSFWLYLSSLISIVFNYMNVGMLSMLSTVSSVGYFSIALNVLRPFEFFPETLNQVFLPRMSEIRNRHDLIKFCRRVVLIGSCVAFTLLPVIIFPKSIIHLFYGAKYADAAPVLRLLSGSMALNIILNPLYLFVHRLNLPRLFTFISAASLAIGISANSILIPQYGELGCAMTMLIVGAATQLTIVPFIIYKSLQAFPKSGDVKT